MPTLTTVPPRPAMPTAYEEKRQQYLDHCAKHHGKAQHYEDILYTVLCDLTDTITDPVQLWQEAERTAAIRIESHPRWVKCQFVPPTQPDAVWQRSWDRTLNHFYHLVNKLADMGDDVGQETKDRYNYLIDQESFFLSQMMLQHESRFGKMPSEVLISGYGTNVI